MLLRSRTQSAALSSNTNELTRKFNLICDS
uniref:Uncharacterized protein n=1 Tax=Arundo donax TaxID=35708 RepID=A0A0A9CHJ9_ARUDO